MSKNRGQFEAFLENISPLKLIFLDIVRKESRKIGQSDPQRFSERNVQQFVGGNVFPEAKTIKL